MTRGNGRKGGREKEKRKEVGRKEENEEEWEGKQGRRGGGLPDRDYWEI